MGKIIEGLFIIIILLIFLFSLSFLLKSGYYLFLEVFTGDIKYLEYGIKNAIRGGIFIIIFYLLIILFKLIYE